MSEVRTQWAFGLRQNTESEETPHIKQNKNITGERAKMGKEFKRLREEKGYSQGRLAREVGVSDNTIYRLEKGDVDPSVGLIRRLVGALGRGVLNVFFGSGEDESEK